MPFIQGQVTSCDTVKNKDSLKVVAVNIGESEDVTIVTNASNIRLDTKTVVATIGTEVDCDGETITIKKTNVGGVMSNGMICDSVMLGWSGGSAGTCINLQNYPEFKIGDPAPREKPRAVGGAAVEPKEPELSAKELKALEKEQRKLELAKKKADRKAKKEDKGNDDDNNDEDADVQKISSTLADSEITDDI